MTWRLRFDSERLRLHAKGRIGQEDGREHLSDRRRTVDGNAELRW